MLSPLRYPGGKAKLFNYFVQIICENDLYDRTYAEPYAGGAGLALKLLSHGYVRSIHLNDIDPSIAAFWNSVVYNTDNLCSLIQSTEISVEEWHKQRAIYNEGYNTDPLSLGFSAYYLNRTSRSGIIEGSGPIGGYAQSGEWKIDARFNKSAQIRQVSEIARYADSINISCDDAMNFIDGKISSDQYLTYLDHPYYVKGKKLYKNFYIHDDHASICRALEENRGGNWVLSYDNTPEIISLYDNFTPTIYNLQYSAGAVGMGSEVVFSSDRIGLPNFVGFRNAA